MSSNAMREAVAAINSIDTRGLKSLLCQLVECDIFDGGRINKTISAIEKARCSLSAPPSNCDVGTPMEQAHRFHTFCIAHQSAIRGMCDPGCPMVENCTDMCQCICTWMQMPYEEGENNGRGS